MAGDKVQISTYAFYNTAVQPPPGGVDLTSEILTLLSTGVVNNSAGKITSTSAVSTAVNPGVTNFLTNNRPYDNTKPKAYLNWILFDNQFNYIASNSGVQQAQPGASKQALVAPLQTISKNGYLYVYVSNESQQDVYFDDLNVKHYTGPLMQEQSYYPFGLQMAGISDKALNKLSSQYKFNGGVELEEDFGVNLYSTFFRQYDPQLGRFSGIDLLSEQSIWVSTYQFALNSPIIFNDPLGLKQELPRYIGDGKYMFKNGTVVGWRQVEDILTSDYGNEMTNIWNAGDANGRGDEGYITSFGFGTNGSGVEGVSITYSFLYQNSNVERHVGMGRLFVSFGTFGGFQSKWNHDQNWVSDANAWNGGLGVLAGGVENLVGKTTIGSNLKVYPRGFRGNQYVTTVKATNVGKIAGTGTLVVGTLFDAYGVYNYYHYGATSPNATSPAKAGTNLGVGVWGLMNPGTAIGAAIYYGIDTFHPGGFEGAMETNERLLKKNQAILGKNWHLHRD